MESAAARGAVTQQDLVGQILSESPARPFWLFRHFTAASIAVQVALDFLCVLVALSTAYAIYRLLGLGRATSYPLDLYLLSATAVAVGFVLLNERNGLYRPGSSLLHIRETEAILRSTCLSTAAFFITGYVFLTFRPSRWVLGMSFVLVLLLVMGQRVIYYGILRRLHLRGYGVERVLIYGASEAGVQVFRKLAQSPRAGLLPLAFVDDDPAQGGRRIYESSYTRRRSLPVVGTGEELEEILNRLQITRVILADSASVEPKFQQISSVCERNGAQISFVPLQYRLNQHWVDYRDLDGVMLADISPIQESNVYRVAKRLMDLVLGGLLLVLTLPLMAVIAAAIWLTSGRPVIFAQERVGQYGRIFRMYKFRTMHADTAPYAPTPHGDHDPRIIRSGRFLRRTSVDELPQLLNILRGEMSLVGPRPEMPFIVEQYTPAQRQRLLAKPGLTGLWQISADRAFEIHENIDYDLYYIRNRSLLLDVVIVLHTVIFAIRGVGAF